MAEMLGTEPVDCPECGSAGSVDGDFCQVCYADVDVPRRMLHPSVQPRFSYVIDELRQIGAQAAEAGSPYGWRIANACRRAESLLFVLRRHFLQEVVLGEEPPWAVRGG
jgi:hypothetical protein